MSWSPPRRLAGWLGLLSLLGMLSLLGLVTCACAPRTRAMPEAPIRSSGALDPLPHTPPPSASPRSGEPTSLSLSGGTDQARAVARRLLEAIEAGERAVLERLLAPRLVHLSARGRGGLPWSERDSVLLRLREAEGARFVAREGREDPRWTGGGRVLPVSLFFPPAHTPLGLRGEDQIVQIPLHEGPTTHLLRQIFGWRYRAFVVVRPGSRPQVVGF